MSLGDDMPAPYSGDLRARVAAAVAGGASARSAAARFGVSVSTAIRWAQRVRVEGHAEPRAMGGDRRSRLPEHRAVVVELLARQPDLTLQEIRDTLTRSGSVSGSPVCGGFSRCRTSRSKKEFPRRRAGSARHSRKAAGLHSPPTGARPQPPGVHRRNLGHHQHGSPPWPGRARPALAGAGAIRTLDSDHAGGRAAPHRDHRALCVRRRRQRRALPCLRRTDARPDAAPK